MVPSPFSALMCTLYKFTSAHDYFSWRNSEICRLRAERGGIKLKWTLLVAALASFYCCSCRSEASRNSAMSWNPRQLRDAYVEGTYVIWWNSQGAFPFSPKCSWQLCSEKFEKFWGTKKKLFYYTCVCVCFIPLWILCQYSLICLRQKKQLICWFMWFQCLLRLQCWSLFVCRLNSHAHKLRLLSLNPRGPIFSCSWHTVGGTSHGAFAHLPK